MARKKLILPIAFGVVAFLGLLAWSPWNVWRYRGDGKFSDRGFFSYPRYVVTFPVIPLYETGERQFHLEGLPTDEMTLMLYVKGSDGSMEERAKLTNLRKSIEAVLLDGRGNDVCRASGRPDPGNRDGVWVLMSGAEAGYWHYRCNHVELHSREA